MALHDDKYDNFMARLDVSRPALALFAAFTATAAEAPATDTFIRQHAPALRTALTAFNADLVQHTAMAGSSKTGTATEQSAFAAFKTFVQNTHTDILQAFIRRYPDTLSTFYPNALGGLTQALKKDRLTRLTAYTEALEAADSTLPALPVPLGAPANTVGERPGVVARRLLTAYEAVAKKKIKSRTTLKDASDDFGPAGKALTDALWRIHCAALYHHCETPRLARTYFDYAHLPHRVLHRKPKTKKKTDKDTNG